MVHNSFDDRLKYSFVIKNRTFGRNTNIDLTFTLYYLSTVLTSSCLHNDRPRPIARARRRQEHRHTQWRPSRKCFATPYTHEEHKQAHRPQPRGGPQLLNRVLLSLRRQPFMPRPTFSTSLSFPKSRHGRCHRSIGEDGAMSECRAQRLPASSIRRTNS